MKKVSDREAIPQVKRKVKRMIYKAHSIILFGSKLMMVLWDVRSAASDSLYGTYRRLLGVWG